MQRRTVKDRMRSGLLWMAAATLVAVAWEARAHGIWSAQRSGAFALIYGHGGEDLDTMRRHGRVQSVAGYDASGAPVAVSLRKTDHLLLVDAPRSAVIITDVLDDGYWSRDPEGRWVNKGRDEVPGATESGRYVKYAVHLRDSLKIRMQSMPDQVLQIVPLRAQLPAHKDESPPLQVLYKGKRVAGAKVTRDYVGDPDAKPMLTGKDGTVTVCGRNQGLNVITVSYDAPPEDPVKAAKTGLLASLSAAGLRARESGRLLAGEQDTAPLARHRQPFRRDLLHPLVPTHLGAAGPPRTITLGVQAKF